MNDTARARPRDWFGQPPGLTILFLTEMWEKFSYYVGVNAGGFLAPLICGTLGEIYGWHWGFSAAGLGMLAGLSIYLAGSRYLPPESPVPTLVRATAPQAEPALLPRFALLTAIAFVVVIFRAAYEQVGNTVALWAADVDRRVGSFVIPMTWFQSLNPLIVFLLTPVVVARWTRLAERGSEPSPLTKMAMGACIVAASYGMLAAVSLWTEANAAQVSWLWLASFFVVITTGELYIVPIGLGLFGRLAPPRLAATTIATWFLAAFLGNLLAGALGTLWSHLSKAEFFGLVGAVAAILQPVRGSSSSFA